MIKVGTRMPLVDYFKYFPMAVRAWVDDLIRR